ncbi:MAG TPA: hypothetical protein DFK11_15600 [Lachnospiraceae bacterium]|nr:hypothetical protein [Lachnospiraceae bacterium]
MENKTKSDRGLRQVPVPAPAAKYLQQYINSLPGTNLFYCQKFPVINDLTAHIFQHNYCSNLCYKIPAISIKMIARLMGDTEKVVIDVYNHVMEEKEDVQTVLVDALNM